MRDRHQCREDNRFNKDLFVPSIISLISFFLPLHWKSLRIHTSEWRKKKKKNSLKFINILCDNKFMTFIFSASTMRIRKTETVIIMPFAQVLRILKYISSALRMIFHSTVLDNDNDEKLRLAPFFLSVIGCRDRAGSHTFAVTHTYCDKNKFWLINPSYVLRVA